jgi:hypothetical protein
MSNTAASRHPSLRPLKRGMALTSVIVFAALFGFSARHAAGSDGSSAATTTTESFFQGGESYGSYGIDGTPSQASPPAAQSRAS